MGTPKIMMRNMSDLDGIFPFYIYRSNIYGPLVKDNYCTGQKVYVCMSPHEGKGCSEALINILRYMVVKDCRGDKKPHMVVFYAGLEVLFT